MHLYASHHRLRSMQPGQSRYLHRGEGSRNPAPDERVIREDFCMANLIDAFHRADVVAAASCVPTAVVLRRRRARKYAEARWRHIRRFVFRGVHLSPACSGRRTSSVQGRRKREGKREEDKDRFSTPTLHSSSPSPSPSSCVYMYCVSHTRCDRCDREATEEQAELCREVRFGERSIAIRLHAPR